MIDELVHPKLAPALSLAAERQDGDVNPVPIFLQVLGLNESADEHAIRRAYARKIAQVDKRHDQASVQRLRAAYEAASDWYRALGAQMELELGAASEPPADPRSHSQQQPVAAPVSRPATIHAVPVTAAQPGIPTPRPLRDPVIDALEELRRVAASVPRLAAVTPSAAAAAAAMPTLPALAQMTFAPAVPATMPTRAADARAAADATAAAVVANTGATATRATNPVAVDSALSIAAAPADAVVAQQYGTATITQQESEVGQHGRPASTVGDSAGTGHVHEFGHDSAPASSLQPPLAGRLRTLRGWSWRNREPAPATGSAATQLEDDGMPHQAPAQAAGLHAVFGHAARLIEGRGRLVAGAVAVCLLVPAIWLGGRQPAPPIVHQPATAMPASETGASTRLPSFRLMSIPVTQSSAPWPPSGTGLPSMDSGVRRLAFLPLLAPIVPDYPALALERRQQGRVSLRVFVNEAGVVKEVSVERSSRVDSLDQAAEAAAWQARFEPYVENGTPRPVSVPVRLRFQLPGE